MIIRRLSYEERCRRYPPILVRLLTIRGRGKEQYWPDDREICEDSNLPLKVIKQLSYSLDWVGIDMPTHFAFMKGCAIDLEKRRTFRRLEWMRKSGYFSHLRKSPLWKSKIEEMVELYGEAT
jgi:hypothetical protein